MACFAPCIDSSGIHIPTYADRLSDLCSAYRSIFGQEAELSPAVSAQISAYIRETPGVLEAEDVRFAVSDRPFFDACSMRTGEGNAQTRFETGI